MNVRKASDSSRSRTHDAVTQLPASVPLGERVQDNPRNVPLHESTSAFQSDSMPAVRSSPGVLARRKEIAVMQSCWIQRLNPSCQGHKSDEERTDPPTNQGHVWTHFTKDFSSCSKRLDKSAYHGRSSSWPPQELFFMKKTASEDFVEVNVNSRAGSVRVTDNNVCLPFEDAADESDLSSKAGSLFIGEEALVPHSWYRGPARDEPPNYYDDKVFRTQLFQLQLKDAKEENKRNESPEMAVPARVAGKAHIHGNLESSNSACKMARMGDFNLDKDIRASFSPSIMGASADADYRTFQTSYLHKDGSSFGNNMPSVSISLQSSSSCLLTGKVGELADVNSRFGQTGISQRETTGNVPKSGKNFGFFHSLRHSKGHATSLEHPLLRSCCDVGAPSRFPNNIRGVKHVATNMYAQGNENTESHGLASDARLSFFQSKGVPLSSNDAGSRSGNDLFSVKDVQGMEATKVFLPRDNPGRHVARSDCKERNLDDYLEYFFRGHEHREPLQTASSTASLHEEYITRQYNKPHIRLIESSSCAYGTDKVKILLGSCQGTSNAAHGEAFGSKIARPSLSPKNGLGQSEQTGNKQCVGETGAVGPHFDRELHDAGQQRRQKGCNDVSLRFGNQSYKICNFERTPEASIPNQSWIKRWHSTSRFSVFPEKMSSSPGADDKLGSKHPLACNCQGKCNLTYDGASTNSCRKAGKPMEGSGSAPEGPLSWYKSHNDTSYSSKYVAPSAQAMAIVGSAASKIDATSLQNRGSFSIWPCPGVRAVQQRRQGEHGAGAGKDKLHVMDMN